MTVTQVRKAPEIEQPDFPFGEWVQEAPEDLTHVNVTAYTAYGRTVSPDAEISSWAPNGDGVFPIMGANRDDIAQQIAKFPAFLMQRGRMGTYVVSMLVPGQPAPLLKWRFAIAPKASSSASPFAPNPPTPTRPGGYMNGANPFGAAYPIPPTSTDPMVTALQQGLEAVKLQLQQSEQRSREEAAERRHREELDRRDALIAKQAEDNRRELREMNERMERLLGESKKAAETTALAAAAPKGPDWAALLPAILPMLGTAAGFLVKMMQDSAMRHEASNEKMIALLTAKPTTDPMALQMIEILKQNRVADAQILESANRVQLESAAMFANLLNEVRQNEPNVSPYAEAFGRAITGIADNVGLALRNVGTPKQLPASNQRAQQPAPAKPLDAPAVAEWFRQFTPEQLDEVFASIRKRAAEAPAQPGVPVDKAPPDATDAGGFDVNVLIAEGKVEPVHVESYLAHYNLNELMTVEWVSILVAILNRGELEATSDMLTNHLLHCTQFERLMPSLFSGIRSDDPEVVAATIDKVMGFLPLAQIDQEYVQSIAEMTFNKYWYMTHPDDEGEEEDQAATG